MLIGVLGPLRVEVAGRPVELGGPVPRRLLAALVPHAGQVVSVDTLIDAVWGDAPPASAVKTVQSYVTRLRDALAGDAGVFVENVRSARRAVDRGEPGEADRLLTDAFALWRGIRTAS